MKPIIAIAATALLLGAPAAFAQSSDTPKQSPDSGAAAQSSGTGASGTETQAQPSDSAGQAGSEATTQAAAAPMGAEEFVRMAGSSNRLEIESSQLAIDRGVDGEVQEFAQQMVEDHTKAGEQMKAALAETDMTSATGEPELDEKHAQMLEELQGLEGVEFSTKYVEMQVKAHDEAVALFEGYAENGEQAALKQFAEQTLPTLKIHQEHIKQIADEQEG